MKPYPRLLRPGMKFGSLELARETETTVCRGDARKYTSFYATGVYGA